MSIGVLFVVFSTLFQDAAIGIHVVSGTNNITSSKPLSTQIPQARLTQIERNRRLIPYATYYISGSNEGINDAAAQQQFVNHQDNVDDQRLFYYKGGTVQSNTATSIVAQAPQKDYYHHNYDVHQESQHPINAYSYIPVAYIPATAPHNFNINQQGIRVPSYHEATAIVEPVKPYRIPKPTAATATTTSGYRQPPSKAHVGLPYFNFVEQSTRTHVDKKKPTHPSTSQNGYLNFRYSNVFQTQTQTPRYETSTIGSTTPIVEITSPKHYLTQDGIESQHTLKSQKGIATPVKSLTYEYPGTSDLTYTVPLSRKVPLPMSKSVPFGGDHDEEMYQSTQTAVKIQQVDAPTHLQNNFPHSLVPDHDLTDFTVDDIFKGYNLNKQLPDKITPDNIKESIQTLSYLLKMLQKADSISHFHNDPNLNSKNILDSIKGPQILLANEEQHKATNSLQNVDTAYDIYEQLSPAQLVDENPSKEEQNTPGRAGIDYPMYSIIPKTSFSCKTQRYKGFFADPETKCQVWHYCDLNGGQASFLCPNGTIFNQAALTCDWWFNVKCSATTQLYVLNERLYKYIIPVRPSFPEDFSGPLVDQYLTEKFKETELNRKYKYPNISGNETSSAATVDIATSSLNLTALNQYDIPTHLLNENL